MSCLPDGRDLHSFPTRRSSDLIRATEPTELLDTAARLAEVAVAALPQPTGVAVSRRELQRRERVGHGDRKSTRLNSSHGYISYAVFCLKKKNQHLGHQPPKRAA